jgi:hypothetical protein
MLSEAKHLGIKVSATLHPEILRCAQDDGTSHTTDH